MVNLDIGPAIPPRSIAVDELSLLAVPYYGSTADARVTEAGPGWRVQLVTLAS